MPVHMPRYIIHLSIDTFENVIHATCFQWTVHGTLGVHGRRVLRPVILGPRLALDPKKDLTTVESLVQALQANQVHAMKLHVKVYNIENCQHTRVMAFISFDDFSEQLHSESDSRV